MSRIDELSGTLFQRLKEIGPIPDTEWQRILPMLSHELVTSGEYLVRAGEIGTTIGYICSGFLRYIYTDPDGKEFTRYFRTAGRKR